MFGLQVKKNTVVGSGLAWGSQNIAQSLQKGEAPPPPRTLQHLARSPQRRERATSKSPETSESREGERARERKRESPKCEYVSLGHLRARSLSLHPGVRALFSMSSRVPPPCLAAFASKGIGLQDSEFRVFCLSPCREWLRAVQPEAC